MEGDSLISELANATGLTKVWVEDELKNLWKKKGLPFENVTLEILREVLADFMQDVLLGAQQEF